MERAILLFVILFSLSPLANASIETREQRILEYIEANPRRWVAGLREGCMLRYEEGKLELIGKRPMRMFRKGTETFEIEPGGDLSFLL